MMWQMGIDTLPEYRGKGLAAYLVNKLMLNILELGKIPYYNTGPNNIPSQKTAHRAGLVPAWVCAYKGIFNGKLTQSTCG
jgi:hypothetical protein